MARTSAWLSAGIGAGHRVGEQPVAPPDAEGPYRVLLCVAVDAVAPVVDVALELAPLRRQVMQRLPQQALGQHGMQVGQQQLFDVGQHGYAVVLPPAPSSFVSTPSRLACASTSYSLLISAMNRAAN